MVIYFVWHKRCLITVCNQREHSAEGCTNPAMSNSATAVSILRAVNLTHWKFYIIKQKKIYFCWKVLRCLKSSHKKVLIDGDDMRRACQREHPFQVHFLFSVRAWHLHQSCPAKLLPKANFPAIDKSELRHFIIINFPSNFWKFSREVVFSRISWSFNI